MGLLTTVTFYNDGADQIMKHSNELAKAIRDACNGIQRKHGQDSAPLGNHANMITLQKPRHADNQALYWHGGNTVICLEEINENNPQLADEATKFLESELRRLKKLTKKG